VEAPLAYGATTLVEHIGQHLGGNAANTSFALARLNCAVQTLSLVGDDASGEFVISRLRSAGVDTGGIYKLAAATSMALSLVNGKAERALLYLMGASGEDFPEPFTMPPGGNHFHLAAVFRMQYLRRHAPAILRMARERGMTTSADTQWDTEGEWMTVLRPSLPHLDLLFVNEDEARLLTGHADAGRAVEALRDAGAPHTVVKLGAEGCLVDGEHVPGFAVDAVDATGAGDCFVAGYLAALSHGFTDRSAARFANAVGAIAVGKIGAVEGLLDWHQTQHWLELKA
jgi:sugar/nucleoside kinase (ribokinase family)